MKGIVPKELGEKYIDTRGVRHNDSGAAVDDGVHRGEQELLKLHREEVDVRLGASKGCLLLLTTLAAGAATTAAAPTALGLASLLRHWEDDRTSFHNKERGKAHKNREAIRTPAALGVVLLSRCRGY